MNGPGNRGGVLGLFFCQVFGMMANRRWRIPSLVHASYKDVARRKDISCKALNHSTATKDYTLLLLSYGWGLVPWYIIWLLRRLKVVQQKNIRMVLEDGTCILEGQPYFTQIYPTLTHKDWTVLHEEMLKIARSKMSAWTDLTIMKEFGGWTGTPIDQETRSNPSCQPSESLPNESLAGSAGHAAARSGETSSMP